jgi:hypothetical protein
MSDPAVTLFEAMRRQRSTDAVDRAVAALLELFHEAHGPLPDGEYSAADKLKLYGEQHADACALLHAVGWGKLLQLPAPDPQALERWQRVRAGLPSVPSRSRRRGSTRK